MGSKKIIVHNRESVNEQTGEVTTLSKSVTIKSKDTDEFFMVFVKLIGGLFELKSALDIKLLVKFCEMATFNTGEILLPAGKRKDLLIALDVKSSHLSNAISRLKKVNLIAGEQGKYYLNPIAVWKGDTKTRDEIIKNKGLDFRVKFTSSQFDD